MKTTLCPVLVLFLCVRLLAAPPDNPALQLKFNWSDPADPATADVRRLGEQTIQQVGNSMINEVNRVLATKGTESAIDEMHLKSLKLPAAAGKVRVATVKRTSLRVRSPANIPDSADLAALMSIQTDLMDGNSPPKLLVQHVEANGPAPAEWRVYRPIATGAHCADCHGPTDAMAPGVKAKLALLYPEDKAVDYAAAEWRGVIRVSIVAADQPAPTKKSP